MSERRTVSILGATGSIGRSTLDLVERAPDRFEVVALTAQRDVGKLAAAALRTKAKVAVIGDPALHETLRAALDGSGIEAAAGPQAIVEAAARGAEWTMASIVGQAGLEPAMAAISAGRTVALANKESLVAAGEVMTKAAQDHGATLLPVDSEHNAIFQALAGNHLSAVEKISVTASGGPFRTATAEEMARATPEAALRHPVWSMGAKISIDSATMFNKGLELIEAARLFDLPEDRIDVLVHPQSVIHSIVHYHDGSMLAQLGSPDMRIPIAHCLAWPGRMATHSPRLDLAALGQLTFFPPDEGRFPALRLAREALRAGGGAAAILSAANEVAVEAFLGRRLGFTAIAELVERVMDRLGAPKVDTLDAVMEVDAAARREARRFGSLAA